MPKPKKSDEMDGTTNTSVYSKARRTVVAQETGKCSYCPPHDGENRRRPKRTSKPRKKDFR